MSNLQARPGAPKYPPLNLELMMRQLADMDEHDRDHIGAMVNMVWESYRGAHHPYYHAASVAYFGPDYDMNGHGERRWDGIVAGEDGRPVFDSTPPAERARWDDVA